MIDWMDGLLFLGGVTAGFVNAIAGAGSALTLPLLMFAGLDANVANGTNRIGALAQTSAATFSYHRQGVTPWRAVRLVLFPTLAGALLGAVAATHVPAHAMNRLFGVLFIALALKPRWLLGGPKPQARAGWVSWLGFLLVGFYGGLFHAGVGLFLLLTTSRLLGLDPVRGNGVKVTLVVCYTAAVLLVFQGAGHVDWHRGLALGAGGLVGGTLGARIAVKRGAGFVRVVVIVALLAAAARALIWW